MKCSKVYIDVSSTLKDESNGSMRALHNHVQHLHGSRVFHFYLTIGTQRALIQSVCNQSYYGHLCFQSLQGITQWYFTSVTLCFIPIHLEHARALGHQECQPCSSISNLLLHVRAIHFWNLCPTTTFAMGH